MPVGMGGVSLAILPVHARRPAGRPAPGRATVGATVPRPTPGTPLRGLTIAGAHPWHRGRAYLAPPSCAIDNPSLGLVVATIRPVRSPRRLAAGRARVGPLTREASDQTWWVPDRTLRPVASPRRLGAGRAYLAPPSLAVGDPTQTVWASTVRPSASPRRPAAGLVWIPPLTREASDQSQTPLVARVVPAANPSAAWKRRPTGAVRIPRTARYPDQPPSRTSPVPAARRGEDRRRARPPGQRYGQVWPPVGIAVPPLAWGVGWNVYQSPASGLTIDYNSVVAIVPTPTTTWTSGTLSAPGTWSFGVRAADGNGEELNLDCALTIILDANGNDITNRPAPPFGLRALARPGGVIRAEWFYPLTRGPKTPVGFNVYISPGTSLSYTAAPAPQAGPLVPSLAARRGQRRGGLVVGAAGPGADGPGVPAAVVSYASGFMERFYCDLAALAAGQLYTVGVRAFNQIGEEPNTLTVTATSARAGPRGVDGIAAVTIV